MLLGRGGRRIRRRKGIVKRWSLSYYYLIIVIIYCLLGFVYGLNKPTVRWQSKMIYLSCHMFSSDVVGILVLLSLVLGQKLVATMSVMCFSLLVQ